MMLFWSAPDENQCIQYVKWIATVGGARCRRERGRTGEVGYKTTVGQGSRQCRLVVAVGGTRRLSASPSVRPAH